MITAGVLSFIAKGIWWFGFIIGAIIAAVVMSLACARRCFPEEGQLSGEGAVIFLCLLLITLIILKSFGVI